VKPAARQRDPQLRVIEGGVRDAATSASALDRSVAPSLDPSVPLSDAASASASPRRRHGAIAITLVFLAGLIYYGGDKRQPVPAAVGNSLSGIPHEPPSAEPTLRVATFNIHGGIDRNHRFNLGRTADALKGFDLVVLNEVHGPYFWQAQGQTEQLAALTGNRWLFAPTEERWWHHRFGNAALTSANVTHWQTIALPSHGRGYRNMLLMTVPHGDRTIHIVGTHLDRADPDDRAEQLQAAGGLFLSLAEPAILLGDLNTTADDPLLRSLLQESGVHDPLQEALGHGGPPHIDWILTRGLETVDAGIIDNGASDHPLVWAELRME
jgi:endonuclease/exonuclease/phosphatase family metal-dependent hydrolase